MGKAFGKAFRIILRLDGWKGRRIVGQNIHENFRVNITWFSTCIFLRGGGTLLYKPYRYVPPHRVGFLPRFGVKTDIHFAHFGLESGMVSRELRECMNVFIVSIPNE